MWVNIVLEAYRINSGLRKHLKHFLTLNRATSEIYPDCKYLCSGILATFHIKLSLLSFPLLLFFYLTFLHIFKRYWKENKKKHEHQKTTTEKHKKMNGRRTVGWPTAETSDCLFGIGRIYLSLYRELHRKSSFFTLIVWLVEWGLYLTCFKRKKSYMFI